MKDKRRSFVENLYRSYRGNLQMGDVCVWFSHRSYEESDTGGPTNIRFKTRVALSTSAMTQTIPTTLLCPKTISVSLRS
jgi:hypothetical protein